MYSRIVSCGEAAGRACEAQEIAGFGEVAWPGQAKPALHTEQHWWGVPINALFEAHTGVL